MSELLIETHLHTAEYSPCAQRPGKSVVLYYKQAGYDGLVVTNHYSEASVYSKGFDGERFARGYIDAAKRIRDYGEAQGLVVYIGCEITLNRYTWRDMLLYGEGVESFLLDFPYAYNFTQEELFREAEARGIFVSQAHPYRMGMSAGDPKFMHAVEAFNAANADGDNALAARFALTHKLKRMAGTDFHGAFPGRSAGIFVDKSVLTDKQLAEYLFTHEPEIRVFDNV